MPLPTFIIAGAPKAGTTALWNYLNEHPEVCMATDKEPGFFCDLKVDREKSGVNWDGHNRPGTFPRGFKWYESLFTEKEGARAWGEASTQYFSAPDSPDLIRKHVPDVRLIFMLRDPVGRLYSQYWQETRLGWDFPPFHEMVRTNHPRFRFYCEVSAYRRHLGDYLTRFPREQVLVLLHPDLKNDPQGVYRRVCSFIGVDAEFAPSVMGRTFNQQTMPRMRFFQSWLLAFRRSRFNERLPEPLRNMAHAVGRALSRANSTPNLYAPLDPSLRSELVPRFEEDIRFVEDLLGVSLDAWRRV